MENCVYGYVFRVILPGNDVQNGDELYYVSMREDIREDNSLIRSGGSVFFSCVHNIRILYTFG